MLGAKEMPEHDKNGEGYFVAHKANHNEKSMELLEDKGLTKNA